MRQSEPVVFPGRASDSSGAERQQIPQAIAAIKRAALFQQTPIGRVLHGADRPPILERQIVVSVARLATYVASSWNRNRLVMPGQIGRGTTLTSS